MTRSSGWVGRLLFWRREPRDTRDLEELARTNLAPLCELCRQPVMAVVGGPPSPSPRLLERLRRTCREGITLSDAQQLFLWLFCTTRGVPTDLEPVTKEVLASTFAALAADRLIVIDARGPPMARASTPAYWIELVRDFLLQQVSLDDSFRSRGPTYVSPE